ncbi:hypothetical protein ACHAXR_011892 [Thalassiosira sp. AJA248-18]
MDVGVDGNATAEAVKSGVNIKEEEYLADTDEDDDSRKPSGTTPTPLLPLSDQRSNVQMALAKLVTIQTEAAGGESNVCPSWERIDFGDIDRSLARKLSDDDIAAILMCINAVDTVKSLKLDCCVNITGRGLNVLLICKIRGSVYILLPDGTTEETDPVLISEETVLPILDSIVEKDQCSLECIKFPYKWFEDDQSGKVNQWFERFQSTAPNRSVACSIRANAIELVPMGAGLWRE